MQIIFGLATIIGIGWLVIQILPVVLPFIGYAIVGIVVIGLFAMIFN